MDPVCHSLVGGCLAEAGFKRMTRLGWVTCLLAANLPDIDVIAIPLGRNLELRRGMTHGVIALIALPLVLAAIMWLIGGRATGAGPRARFGVLLGISAVGVLTHPVLDWLNTYGMRWLMPFDGRWFYGDTLFIVDPWIWLVLGVGIAMSRRSDRIGRRAPGRPARAALAAVAIYVGAMMTTTVAARNAVRAEVGDAVRFMTAPTFANPLAKEVVVDAGGEYRIGRYQLVGQRRLTLDVAIPRGADSADVAAVAATDRGRAFLDWARFPAFIRREGPGDSLTIRAYDLRYSRGAGDDWASVVVVRPPAGASSTGR